MVMMMIMMMMMMMIMMMMNIKLLTWGDGNPSWGGSPWKKSDNNHDHCDESGDDSDDYDNCLDDFDYGYHGVYDIVMVVMMMMMRKRWDAFVGRYKISDWVEDHGQCQGMEVVITVKRQLDI